MDSFIRLRQLNRSEISGYAVEIIKQYLFTGTGITVSSTGSLTGSFYPRHSNPSGYITGSQTGIVFKSDTGFLVDDAQLAFTEANILSQSSGLYYPLSNPSGFIQKTTSDKLYVSFGPTVNTGQIIFNDDVAVGYSIDFNPNKWFFLRGTGQAEIDFYNVTGAKITGFSIHSNSIYLSGKTVLNDSTAFINVRDYSSNTGLILRDNVKSIFPFEYKQNDGFAIRGVENAIIDFYDSGRSYNTPYISGFDIYINGSLFTGSSGSAGTGVSFAQLTGASGVLRNDIEILRAGTGKFITTGQSGEFVGKSQTGHFLYNAMRNQAQIYGPFSIHDYLNAITLISITPTGGNGYYLRDSSGHRVIDFSGTLSQAKIPTISGFRIDASGITISGKPVLTRESGDALYYLSSNPSDYASKSYVNSQITNQAILKGNVSQNTSLYLIDQADMSNPFAFDPQAVTPTYYLFGDYTKKAIIDLAGTYDAISSFSYQQPFISGFNITGTTIWADEIYLDGLRLIESLSGQHTGLSLSKYDDRHNTRMTLWNTGSNTTGMFFSGGNGPFYLRYVYRYENGALEIKNIINLQESYIDGFGISGSLGYEQDRGVFELIDGSTGAKLFYWNQDSGKYYLSSENQSAYIDFEGSRFVTDGQPRIQGFHFSGDAISGGTISATKEIYLSGQPIASRPYVTGVSGYLQADLDATGALLYGLIQASSAGVSALNGLSGTLTLTGAGGVIVTNVGQVITVSGNTSTYVTTGNTGNFVTTIDSRNLKLNGVVEYSSRLHTHVIESELSSSAINYYNVAYMEAVNASGAWILNTPIPRTSNLLSVIHVKGFGFADSPGLGTTSAVIDFVIQGYAYNGISGNIDGQVGGIFGYSVSDRSTTKDHPIWIGINQSGNLAVAFGNTGSIYYTYRTTADVFLSSVSALISGVYHSGWNFTTETGVNFRWLDRNQVSGIQWHNHLITDIIGTGAFYPRTGNPSGYLISNDTGIFDNTFVSHIESGALTGTFVRKSDTGIFDNTFISHVESGSFYPRSGNPSGYLSAGSTGILVGHDQTGIYNLLFYPRDSNPNNYQSSDGAVTGKHLISNKYGYGAGIYTFEKTLNPNITANIFSISSSNGTQVFDVMINCDANRMSVAKSYSVVHAFSGNPRSFLKLNTGPYISSNRDFNVEFIGTGNNGTVMKIINSTTETGQYIITLVLGGCYNPVTIIEH
jgi:hypothetical protein